MTSTPDPRSAFGARLAERRDAVFMAWEARVAADPKLVTGQTMPRVQLHDHLTALLEDFERQLKADVNGTTAAQLSATAGDAAAHGLHRWQQGFDLAELIRELGRLNECVTAEIHRIGTEPAFAGAPALVADVQATWCALYSEATTSSASQYFKLQQIEAAGHVQDLEQALDALRALETQRAMLWQEAAHDLRGNLSVVSVVAAGLNLPSGDVARQRTFAVALERNVRALNAILEDVTSLARLQGGQEVRALAEVEVGRLFADMRTAMDGLAQERGLELRAEGPAPFTVQGDAIKIRRIVQNLVLNALRYTRQGSVTVGWGPEPGRESVRWRVWVDDTGPGLQLGPGSGIAGALSVASEQARDMADAAPAGGVVHVSAADADPTLKPDGRGRLQGPGEGIGLSIVKRLCTLLDATIEIESRPDHGTVFRILLPLRYEDAPAV